MTALNSILTLHFERQAFMIKSTILTYAHEHYNSIPEHPFKSSPTTAVLRHQTNRKWYGVFMTLSKRTLGIDSDERMDLILIKLQPDLVAILRAKTGYFPAYHMNKEHWISITLDGTVPAKEICSLLDDSYLLTK